MLVWETIKYKRWLVTHLKANVKQYSCTLWGFQVRYLRKNFTNGSWLDCSVAASLHRIKMYWSKANLVLSYVVLNVIYVNVRCELCSIKKLFSLTWVFYFRKALQSDILCVNCLLLLNNQWLLSVPKGSLFNLPDSKMTLSLPPCWPGWFVTPSKLFHYSWKQARWWKVKFVSESALITPIVKGFTFDYARQVVVSCIVHNKYAPVAQRGALCGDAECCGCNLFWDEFDSIKNVRILVQTSPNRIQAACKRVLILWCLWFCTHFIQFASRSNLSVYITQPFLWLYIHLESICYQSAATVCGNMLCSSETGGHIAVRIVYWKAQAA